MEKPKRDPKKERARREKMDFIFYGTFSLIILGFMVWMSIMEVIYMVDLFLNSMPHELRLMIIGVLAVVGLSSWAYWNDARLKKLNEIIVAEEKTHD